MIPRRPPRIDDLVIRLVRIDRDPSTVHGSKTGSGATGIVIEDMTGRVRISVGPGPISHAAR